MALTDPQPASKPAFTVIGENPTRLWGLTSEVRANRIARAANLATTGEERGSRVLANAAFAFDPAWMGHIVGQPGTVLTLGGVPALAHVRDHDEAQAVIAAMEQARPLDGTALHVLAFEDGPTVENKTLRKRETPFVIPLRPETVRRIERASYFGAYKGVTDVLTKYLWPEWALVLTRVAAITA